MRRLILVAVAAAAIVAAVVPLAAVADRGGGDGRATLGLRLDFSSDTQAAGTFAVCCSVTDSGTAHAEVTSFVPKGDRARFRARVSLNGQHGSFATLLRGTTGPLDSPIHVARARWRVSDGSGAYAGLEGHGRLTAATNQTTGALTAILKGELEPDGDD
jgi:hypothetical protein